MEPRRVERTVTIFASPEDAEAETRRAYRQLSGNERVAITVELQRRYYQDSDPPRRLQKKFLRCLNARDVCYMVIGGHAVSSCHRASHLRQRAPECRQYAQQFLHHRIDVVDVLLRGSVTAVLGRVPAIGSCFTAPCGRNAGVRDSCRASWDRWCGERNDVTAA